MTYDIVSMAVFIRDPNVADRVGQLLDQTSERYSQRDERNCRWHSSIATGSVAERIREMQ